MRVAMFLLHFRDYARVDAHFVLIVPYTTPDWLVFPAMGAIQQFGKQHTSGL